jgi:hypothetical protein
MPFKATYFQTTDTPLVDARDERRITRALVSGTRLYNDSDFAVTAAGGMKVQVAACAEGGGLVWSPGRFAHRGAYWCYSDENIQFTLGPADAAQARTDTVAIALHDGEYEGDASFTCAPQVFAGTPGGGAPTIPGDSYPLANVAVAAAASSISAANITDRRGGVGGAVFSDRYGVVTLPATGTLGSLAPPTLTGWWTTAADGTMTFARSGLFGVDLTVSRAGTTPFILRVYGPNGSEINETTATTVGGTTARAYHARILPLTKGQTLRLAGMSTTAGAMTNADLNVRVFAVL